MGTSNLLSKNKRNAVIKAPITSVPTIFTPNFGLWKSVLTLEFEKFTKFWLSTSWVSERVFFSSLVKDEPSGFSLIFDTMFVTAQYHVD